MTPSRLLVAHGARAVEDLLLARLSDLAAEARRDPMLLARPVRVVVPSISLRDHLATAIVHRAGRAMVGVRVMTLLNVALELAARAGRPAPRSPALFDVLVRRFARAQSSLHGKLDDLHDGYAVVSTSVRDLLDAGLEPAHVEAVDELLRSEGRHLATRAEIDRAGALVRTAVAVERALEELGVGHRSTLLRAARDRLEAEGPPALVSRALLVHGFAGANGVEGDLLESLLRIVGGDLYLDRPPENSGAFESAHTLRLVLRLAPVTGPPRTVAPEEELSPSYALFAAPDAEAEMREVARRVGALLEAGARPESIGVVARTASAVAPAVRRHFDALGIPFSGVSGEGPLRPAGRRLALLLELLRRGPVVNLERWLDAAAHLDGSAELRQGFSALGASRLEDLDRLELPAHADERLRTAATAGRRLAAELHAWRQGQASFAEQRARLERLLAEHLGWPTDGEPRRLLEEALDGLAIPGALALDHDELTLVLATVFRNVEREPLGGRGGGVQVLSAAEARGRTFEHLFLCAVVRDVFPRPLREEALLSDRLRQGLARLLPDLRGRPALFDEERHLFAELLSSAPRVTLSWHEQDASGRPCAPSPLLERLRRQGVETARAPQILAPGTFERPLVEELQLRGVHGPRSALGELLPAALAEADLLPDAAALAAGRLAVLNELDPDRGVRDGAARARGLGPYFGFLGEVAVEDDPRREPLYVTTLERLALCPWQTFLRRLLGLRPMPDPLGSLPSLRGLLVGVLVHRVLERIGKAGRGGLPAWPPPEELEAVTTEEAVRVLEEHGLGLKGLVRAAVEQARPYLEAARRLDRTTPALPLLNVESRGSVTVTDRKGAKRLVRFRADRLDAEGDRRRYTDYKTGARPRGAGDRESVLGGVRAGRFFQAAAYVHDGGAEAEGRYLFLRPDLEETERVISISGGDRELLASFEESARKLLAAWDAGVFFPRLVAADEDVEPPLCRSCRFAEACSRRDSGARGRLRRFAERHREAAERGELDGVDRCLLDLYLLGS